MSRYLDSDRQIGLIMMHLSERDPGLVCLDSKCQTHEPVPHMANDGGNHPHPYSIKSPWTAAMFRKLYRDRKAIRD